MSFAIVIYLFVVAAVALIGLSKRPTTGAARRQSPKRVPPQSRTAPQRPVDSHRVAKTAGLPPSRTLSAPELKVSASEPSSARATPTARSKSPRTRSFAARVEEIMSDAQRFFALNSASEEEKETLTAHQRRYYDHYNAASSQLARGNIRAFKDEIKRAGRELAEIEEILSDHWQELSGQAVGRAFAFDPN